MPDVDEAFNKLENDLGRTFRSAKPGVSELYSFRCGSCGYRNIHDCKSLLCGCGAVITGTLAYRKVGDVVIWDLRGHRTGRRRR